MKKTDIQEKLKDIIMDDEIKTRKNRFTTIDWFLKTFGDYDLNYESLISHPDVKKMGWDEILKEWKEKGYID